MLDLFFLGVTLISNIVLYSDTEVPLPNKGEVAQVSFHREWWRDDSKCRFKGVVVPYARDWEEVSSNGIVETKLAPEPDKIVGFAYVINKKVCPGKADEPMFNTADWFGGFFDPKVMHEKFRIDAVSVQGKPVAEQPRWLPQVLKTIENAAATNEAAKDFLDFSRQAAEAAKAAKADATAKMAKEGQPEQVQ